MGAKDALCADGLDDTARFLGFKLCPDDKGLL